MKKPITYNLRIYVTQKDIDEGVACNCTTCPVARAIKRTASRQLPDKIEDYNVNSGGITLSTPTGSLVSYTPPKSNAFIVNFDRRWLRATKTQTLIPPSQVTPINEKAIKPFRETVVLTYTRQRY